MVIAILCITAVAIIAAAVFLLRAGMRGQRGIIWIKED